MVKCLCALLTPVLNSVWCRNPFTHEFLAEQLGVQRGTVTEALAVLQEKKLVESGYGKVKVLKSTALEKVSCDCFQLAKQAIEEYLEDMKAYKRSMA